MKQAFYVGFWVFFVVVGVSIILNTNTSFSSVTCLTGEIARNVNECPECLEDKHCEGVDNVCDVSNNKCIPRPCFSGADCKNSSSVCEYNKCLTESDLY